jgi:hypothetical protein
MFKPNKQSKNKNIFGQIDVENKQGILENF